MTKHACNTETEKYCPTCKTVKSRTEFYKNRTAYDGLQPRCKPCNIETVRQYHKKDPARHAAYNREWDKRNPEKKKDNSLKTRRGVPQGTYAAMLAAQNGVCAICGTLPGEWRFHLDHCKETNVIRGLLCSCCNTGIGQLKHRKDLLESAIRYLSDYPGLPVGSTES